MKAKTLTKLALNQETLRSLTANEPIPGFAPTKNCPKQTIGFPVCTPVAGVN